jgi:YD repeat-containing protein
MAMGMPAHAQADAVPSAMPHLLVVVGVGGDAEYEAAFQEWAERLKPLSQRTRWTLIDGSRATSESDVPSHREQIQQWIAQVPKEASSAWIIFIGHGTFDAKVAKVNLRGPDVSANDLSKWMTENKQRWVIINCASCSGAFMNELAGPERVIVTATKSGSEVNYARFGDYFSAAIIDPQSDLDHDESVSVLEAFLAASQRTRQYYDAEGRLASEQALIDDNGDKRGTPASFFRGIRVVATPQADPKPRSAKPPTALPVPQVDGPKANRFSLWRFGSAAQPGAEELARDQALEEAVEKLRRQKASLSEDDYYQALEKIFLDGP